MTPKQQLAKFLAKYDPSIARQAKTNLAKMRKLIPGAIEMVYDNYNFLVIGFGPTEKPSLAVFSLALSPTHMSLCFLQGKGLPDPKKRLQGSGNLVRNIRLTTPHVLDETEVRYLVQAAKDHAKMRFDPKQKSKLIIKFVSKKQRPRRPKA
jgi:hypothetical protein